MGFNFVECSSLIFLLFFCLVSFLVYLGAFVSGCLVHLFVDSHNKKNHLLDAEVL